MNKNYINLIMILLMISGVNLQAQTQIGADIDGVAPGDQAGFSISMPDVNTIAVGGLGNDANGSNSGHTRIFTWDGSTWTQKGTDIQGEASDDNSGFAVNMPNANTIAIGAHLNDGTSTNMGHVRIYDWDGSTWTQRGADIDGEAASDQFGSAVNMPDANTVAIGGFGNDGGGISAGHVRVYTWNGSAWIQKGADIDGEAANDQSGRSISMPDANTIAIGAFQNDGNGSNSGHVRIYTWNGSAWIQKGLDIDGESINDRFGWSVSMPDPDTIASGARYNNDGGVESGHVRIFTWNGTAWIQKGLDIDGEQGGDQSGVSVSMPNANTIAIGANRNNGSNGTDSGHVRVYTWDGTAWTQRGNDIDGEFTNDLFGGSVVMPDADTVAAGAAWSGNFAGHARVFSFAPLSIEENEFTNKFVMFPNPTKGKFALEFEQAYERLTVKLMTITGALISTKKFEASKRVDLDIKGAKGMYLLEITNASNQKVTVKVIKE